MVGVVIQIATTGGSALGLIVAGRLIAGIGVGFESAIVILYMSEICPRKVRGALVAGYQFCITIGLLMASGVNYAVQDRPNPSSYRIPIGIQFAWGVILGGGLLFLPDSPRFFVKRGRVEKARHSLSRLRGQPETSEYIESELAEIIANEVRTIQRKTSGCVSAVGCSIRTVSDLPYCLQAALRLRYCCDAAWHPSPIPKKPAQLSVLTLRRNTSAPSFPQEAGRTDGSTASVARSSSRTPTSARRSSVPPSR